MTPEPHVPAPPMAIGFVLAYVVYCGLHFVPGRPMDHLRRGALPAPIARLLLGSLVPLVVALVRLASLSHRSSGNGIAAGFGCGFAILLLVYSVLHSLATEPSAGWARRRSALR